MKARRRRTFDDIAAVLTADYRLNGRRSLSDAEVSLEHLRGFFGGDAPIETITHERLTDFASERITAGRARATVRKNLAALKRAFRLASRNDPRIVPPTFPEIRVQNARKGFIDGPRFERLKHAAPDHVRPLIVFLFLTGWRVSEARALRWEQVDVEAGVVRIEPGESKNGEGRDFPFREIPELETMLREQREWVSKIEWDLSLPAIPWVFCYPNGRRFNDFRDVWARVTKGAGLKGLWVHDLRRSAVRNFERAKVRRQTAMKLTGHKTEEIYRRYAISDFTDLQEAARAIAALRARDTARPAASDGAQP
jgi:integrase